MHFVSSIKYAGRFPVKVDRGGGWYLNTFIADDVPVTNIEALRFLGFYRAEWQLSSHLGDVDIKLNFHGTERATFIGEQVLIMDLLDEMVKNSIDAGATVIQIEVVDEGERLKFVISDDGKGIPASMAELVLRTDFTTKATSTGFALYYAALRIKKICGEVEYLGAGIDDKGASFAMSFLKEMPDVD